MKIMAEYNIEFDEIVLKSLEADSIEMLSTDGKWIGTYTPGGGWVKKEEKQAILSCMEPLSRLLLNSKTTR